MNGKEGNTSIMLMKTLGDIRLGRIVNSKADRLKSHSDPTAFKKLVKRKRRWDLIHIHADNTPRQKSQWWKEENGIQLFRNGNTKKKNGAGIKMLLSTL